MQSVDCHVLLRLFRELHASYRPTEANPEENNTDTEPQQSKPTTLRTTDATLEPEALHLRTYGSCWSRSLCPRCRPHG